MKDGEFRCRNCGECCGPVPLFDFELRKIRTAVLAMPEEERERLRTQERGSLACPLRDVEKKCCSVYSQRPIVCRQFGAFEGLECPQNKGVRLRSFEEARTEFFKQAKPGRVLVGVLGVDIGWAEIENPQWDPDKTKRKEGFDFVRERDAFFAALIRLSCVDLDGLHQGLRFVSTAGPLVLEGEWREAKGDVLALRRLVEMARELKGEWARYSRSAGRVAVSG